MKPTTTIGIIILAAGASTRMGQSKQLLPFKGETLIRNVVKTALETGCRPVIVVLGAFANEIKAELYKETSTDLKMLVVENPAWHEGMSTSLKIGLETLLAENPNAGAALFLLTDQPLLTTEYLSKLIKQLPDTNRQQQETSIVASFYNDTNSVPALFDKKWFPELMQLTGDQGARKLLELHRKEVHAIPFPAGAFDLDTPEDYQQLLKHF